MFLFILLCFGALIIGIAASYFTHKFLSPQIPIVEYSITGNEKGKAICFIHGWPDTADIWKEQIAHFKDKYACINFKLPNFDIDNINNPWGYEIMNVVTAIANKIQYILQTKYPKQQKEGVILLIHDWGSIVGQLLIKHYPHLVHKAVIVDIGNSFPSVLFVIAYQWFNIFCFLLPRSIGDGIMRAVLYKVNDGKTKIPIVDCERNLGKKLMHSRMNYFYFYLWKDLIFKCGKVDRLSVPKCPTFFLRGKLGPWHTKKWQKILTERDDCEYKRYDDANHWVMCDQCDRFNKDISQWLAK